ncbi:MAG: prepilin-type N-terminal cleavage/methylation domain-containing protein [Deltaproteobacteria bacterium]|nr:prepilin-type N-terminal cleavage/methylation domain-containing protein [Deltaproteobacteria bacterium]
MRNYNGYTLVEMLISLAVGMVVIAAIYAIVNLGQKSTANVERKVSAYQDARAALELMSLEIEMASYNPRPDLVNSTFWRTSGTCGTSANQNYRGIQQATGSSLTVEMNLNANNSIGANVDEVNESITYTYDSGNQYITRSTDCGAGSNPFLGNMPGSPRVVRVINTSAVPVFRYFNAQGTEITSGQLPAGIPDIARINITLWVETEGVDMNSGKRRKIVYSTSVIPRNHVISR